MQQTLSENPLLIRLRPIVCYGRAMLLGMPIVLVAILITHFHTWQVDDAFITYRYAQSLARGAGFSYNPPEIVFGATTPLYTLLLALAGLVRLDIPLTSLVLNAISLVALAFITRQIVALHTSPALGTITAFIIVLLPGSYMSLGMETLLYTALLYGGLLASGRQQYRVALLASACATLTRYDGVMLAGVVLLGEWAQTRRLPWRNMLLYGLMLLPWLLAAQWMFGSQLPNTFAAKAGFANLPNSFLVDLPLVLALAFTSQPFTAMPTIVLGSFIGLGVCGVFSGLRRAALRLLVGWLAIYTLAYIALRLAYTHPWYYYPLLPGLVIIITVGLYHLVAWVRQMTVAWTRRPRHYALLLSSGCGALLAGSILAGTLTFWQGDNLASVYRARAKMYVTVGEWLCRETPPDATVALTEIGIIGWTCPRFIIDAYGLVTPQVVEFVRQNDHITGLVKLRPDYIIVQNLPLHAAPLPLPAYQQFVDRYQCVKIFEQVGFPNAVAVYAKIK